MTTDSSSAPILPGRWLGMIGGGQLGRMFCHAAQSMGYKVVVLDPDTQSPAGAVAERHICAAYTDPAGLAELAAQCEAVTTEFENVPADSLRTLAASVPVRPSGDAVAVVQDRIREKAFIESAGVPVAPYCPVHTVADLQSAPDSLFPGILKVARLGYDGKGQARVATREQALAAFQEFGQAACVLEAMLPLVYEISVVMARGQDGQFHAFPVARNEHRQGILAVSTVDPSLCDPALAQQALQAAEQIAARLQYVGVMCVEFFVLADGRLIANEIAPRPHNSGHYTMNACAASQFEQQVRTLAGLPLGSSAAHSPALMLNLLGDLWFDAAGTYREPDWVAVLAVPGASLHLYGKAQARAGRKMGHINVVAGSLDQVNQHAARVAAVLGIPFVPLHP